MDISVEIVVTDVAVYPDRARVSGVGECELTSGRHRLLVPGLPLTMDSNSVRVRGSGSAKVRLLGVEVTRQFFEEAPQEAVRELENQIEEVQESLRALEDEKAGWLAHGVYLHGIRQATAEFAKGLSRGKTTVAEQQQVITFLQEQDAAMRTAVRQLDQKQKTVMRRLQKLQQELKQIKSSKQPQQYQAQIEVEVLHDGRFQPEISYVVNQAGWQPLYDIRLVEENGRTSLELNYLAQITQRTGQAWEQVNLAVSTARPALNQQLPEMHPWYIREYQPPVPQPRPMVRAAAPMAAKMEMMVADAAPAPEPEAETFAAETVTATIESEGTAVTFKAPVQINIPNDGSPYKTTLQQIRLEPKLDYLTIPKYSDAAFRRATVAYTESGPLLPGTASLFVGEEYIGQTQIKFTAQGDKLELLLGVEDRITVERKLARRDVDKKLLRDQRQLRYGYTIAVKNLLTTSAQVVVKDHIPVSRHEQIKVKLDDVRPQPTEQTDLNLLEWQLNLVSGAEQTVRYDYTVEHPRSLQVVGLLD
ncbi:MAG: mucoidy inhibitor MuiA family protein [Ardenticatenaceae bacterium]|nr:mucoidy inhibitor MuiA family protein [Anaerolineales bacterium]MCB8940979.1 mucoidy inhibitor MuiA family protein [Ardenticatenaceae bacterium]MCB8972318.1 mucoidy inhibitor MuiA family protein [Ardenticatenaceae bacterium]